MPEQRENWILMKIQAEQTSVNSVLDRLGKSDQELVELLATLALCVADGHFTILKFTTNWRVGFGTAESREDIAKLTAGRTLREALGRLLSQLRVGEARSL